MEILFSQVSVFVEVCAGQQAWSGGIFIVGKEVKHRKRFQDKKIIKSPNRRLIYE
jgi:hypothetical protein